MKGGSNFCISNFLYFCISHFLRFVFLACSKLLFEFFFFLFTAALSSLPGFKLNAVRGDESEPPHLERTRGAQR